MSLTDITGVTILMNARVLTKNNKVGYVISLHPSTGKVRVKFENNMVRKFLAHHLRRA